MTSCYRSIARRKKGKQRRWQEKRKKKKSDLICEQYINASKLGAN
jgi:hypothetical protein